ncbi:hypothetical protein NKH72_22025 [Mesorhizobium sp. M0955]|uniref:DUF6197 family protein n=1 Tax=Mesorhizobium sp. M0955 TaxID=2957033 RepID=UPI00333505D2
MKTALEIVEGVIELFDDPKKWWKDDFAVNGKGDVVDPRNPHAQCWCLQGAIDKVAGARIFSNEPHEPKEWDLRKTIREAFEADVKPKGFVGMVDFNDDENTKFQDVVDLCKRTAERLREKAA